MSLKNKTINSLKYFDWVSISYNDAAGLTASFSKIDLDSLEQLPGVIENISFGSRTKTFISYWYQLDYISHMLWNIGWNAEVALADFSDKPLIEINKEDLAMRLNAFLELSLNLWRSLLPLLNDFNTLYKKHNKNFSGQDFLLLDFWFHNLSVIDELMQAFNELELEVHFTPFPFPVSSEWGFRCDAMKLHEPTEEATSRIGEPLDSKKWSKNDFANYIYIRFLPFDINVFYEWLIYKKIENIYESKEAIVYAYLTNSKNGLNSLSLSTLKLLTINPILDFDILRKLHEQRENFDDDMTPKIKLWQMSNPHLLERKKNLDKVVIFKEGDCFGKSDTD